MGGGRKFHYPKYVWSPAGGWWNQPKVREEALVWTSGSLSLFFSSCNPRSSSHARSHLTLGCRSCFLTHIHTHCRSISHHWCSSISHHWCHTCGQAWQRNSAVAFAAIFAINLAIFNVSRQLEVSCCPCVLALRERRFLRCCLRTVSWPPRNLYSVYDIHNFSVLFAGSRVCNRSRC